MARQTTRLIVKFIKEKGGQPGKSTDKQVKKNRDVFGFYYIFGFFLKYG